MKVYEMLKICKDLLFLLSEFEIKTEDAKYVELYNDYVQQRKLGIKVACIMDDLQEKYGVSESTIHRLLRKFSKEL